PVLNTPQKADCSDAQIGAAATATGTWDPYRTKVDPTGYVDRTLAYMPLPNAFDSNDGLNTASIRWLRHLRGQDNLFGASAGTTAGAIPGARRQINIKVDHNFNNRHKATINTSYERDDSDDTFMNWPGTF